MDRRELLAGLGAVLGTASLGGCLGRYRDAIGGAGETTQDGTTQNGTTRDTTDGQSGTTTGRPATLADTSFQPLSAGCGQPTNEASVRFRRQANEVVVTGTIPGSNACYTAKLADASYDPETGTLDLTVASTQQKDGADVCAQCITQIEYEATAAFEGGLPESVRVIHEAMGETRTVATVAAGGATTTEATRETTADGTTTATNATSDSP